MSSLSPQAAPLTCPPSIVVPNTGDGIPRTPPTAAGNGFTNVHDRKDNGGNCDGQEQLLTMSYAEVHEKKKGSAVSGVQRGANKFNDPFDFVERLPEDVPYEEMGETARLWKIFLQERGKVDADKVQNWKDALDVLLVFAGLFSAVVSSFVLETYQTLQMDNVQVIALLVVELVGLQRTTDASTVPATDITPLTDFRPARSAVWVNGMWFVSLVLSLTAATTAALTKQWVNEYLDSAQVGTPRTLSRVRQFRAVQLETWHVPVIIGLLPVLMHVSLALFLAGLIVFLFTLSTPLAVAITLVVAGTLSTYLATNFLPLYDPSCPYKTPLTNYLYLAYHFLCHLEFPRHWLSYLSIPSATSSDGLQTMPSSLKDAEEQLVSNDAASMEAQIAVWLYNVSANSSIQRCVVESLSNIPLSSVNFVVESLTNLPSSSATLVAGRLANFENLLKGLLDSTSRESVTAYSRLRRTLLRFYPESKVHVTEVPPAFDCNGDSVPALLSLSQPSRAAEYIKNEILVPTARHDIVMWTQILRNALYSGHEWMDIGVPNSSLWLALIKFACENHTCEQCAQMAGSPGFVYRVPLVDSVHRWSTYGNLTLAVLEPSLFDVFGTSRAMTFPDAVKRFLQPSFCELVLRFRSMAYALDVPSDIRLQLDLIRSSVTQRTSSTKHSWTTAGRIIKSIHYSLGILGISGTHIRHPDILETVFDVTKNVVSLPNHLQLDDRRGVILACFRPILIDRTLMPKYRAWMTKDLARTIAETIFSRFSAASWYLFVAPALSDALQAAVLARCAFLIPEIYGRMRESNWLNVLSESRTFLSKGPQDQRHISFLAAAYLRGLAILRDVNPDEYNQSIAYCCQPIHALELGQVLLLSDLDTRRELHTLVALIPLESRGNYLRKLSAFLKTSSAQDMCSWRMSYPRHPYIHGLLLTYDPTGHLETYLSDCVSALDPHPSTINRV